jgi:Ala-tRNA(Pro) deacylase
VDIAHEDEFADRFPGCETGAMPPFGELYEMEVFLSPHLAEAEAVAFNAGTHTEVMRLGYSDFARLVKPVVVELEADPGADR